MQIVEIPVSQLVPDPNNARTHDQKNLDAIKGSLAKFKQQKPIVIDKNNVVIAGNGTLEAAKALGWEKVACVRSDLKTNTDKTAYALADNRTAELADWDREVLGSELQSLREDGFDIEEIGFEMDELPDDAGTEGLTDPDDVPEVEQNKFGVQRGDIWQLGKHRLMCGDSTSKDDVDRLMDGDKADMVFTDPPYGIDAVSDGKVTAGNIPNNKLAKPGLYKRIEGDQTTEVFRKCYSHLAEIKKQVVWGGNYFTDILPLNPHWLVWSKRGYDKEENFSGAELAWTNIGKVSVKLYSFVWDGMWREGNKIDELKTRVHPTQKPVGLFEKILSDIGGDIVLDPFLGSGSTLIACEKTGRKCYGMEIDPHYCSVIIQRWQDFTGETASKVS